MMKAKSAMYGVENMEGDTYEAAEARKKKREEEIALAEVLKEASAKKVASAGIVGASKLDENKIHDIASLWGIFTRSERITR